jgi:xylulokinase
MEPFAGFGVPVPVGRAVGTSTGEHGIPAGITLVPGSNDAYMTVWSSGIDAPGKAFDPGGKAGGLGIAVLGAGHEDLARYGMPTHVPGVYIIGGPTASHGAIMDWWSEITGRSVEELIDLAADVPAGSEGVTVLPYMEGARAPRWNRDLSGEIVGLSLGADVGVISRAILEGTAYGLGHIARSLQEQGATLDRVVSSGKPSRSPLWVGIKAAVLEVPIDVPDCMEMAAYGAALAAGAGIDWWPRPGEGSPGDWPMPSATTVDPVPEEIYRKKLEEFIALGDEAAKRVAADRVGN